MATITREKVHQISRLAHLNLSSEEEKLYQQELEVILTWIGQLQSLDLQGVEPMLIPHAVNLVMSEDRPEESPGQDEILANAPKAKYGYFTVPKIIE